MRPLGRQLRLADTMDAGHVSLRCYVSQLSDMPESRPKFYICRVHFCIGTRDATGALLKGAHFWPAGVRRGCAQHWSLVARYGTWTLRYYVSKTRDTDPGLTRHAVFNLPQYAYRCPTRVAIDVCSYMLLYALYALRAYKARVRVSAKLDSKFVSI